MTKTEKLSLWKERAERSESAYAAELARMDERESLYAGDDRTVPVVERQKAGRTAHVRNLCAELIEAQVMSALPQPKVSPCRAEDEELARLIEDMLRNEMDRLPMEVLNDQLCRTVPIQGGGGLLVEWDDRAGTPYSVGELAVSLLHPRQIIPQEGVTSDVEDMDYILLKIPGTRASLSRRYGADLSDARGDGEETAEDLLTQYVAYYRNEEGGIGIFSWVDDHVLEDREDYQARSLRRCTACGTVGAAGTEVCPRCGGKKWRERMETREILPADVVRSDGTVIPAGTEIPYYEPGIYPVILQKNVSIFGKFLGDSDVDKVADQQNTTNHVEHIILEKLLSGGSVLTLPDDAAIETGPKQMRIVHPGSMEAKAMIGVYDLQGNIAQDMAYLSEVYEEARQAIGITDSFLGRRDTTATSGRAKEFAAAQSAGRLESKRVLRDAAFARLFEAMFRFKLAFADEPRPVVSRDLRGRPRYARFDRYDFLEQDPTGAWHWNDRFLFSCDTSAPLASNREAMWQETRLNLQSGAFGDPTLPETRVLFWTKMEQLHYPGAGETRRYLEEQAETASGETETPSADAAEVLSMARRAAAKAALQRYQAGASSPQDING